MVTVTSPFSAAVQNTSVQIFAFYNCVPGFIYRRYRNLERGQSSFPKTVADLERVCGERAIVGRLHQVGGASRCALARSAGSHVARIRAAWRNAPSSMSGHAHGSPEKIMAAERPCPAGPRAQASRLSLGDRTRGKAVASRYSSRTQLSELAGLGGWQHGERNVGRQLHPARRLPGLVQLSSPRHAALILSSLQPPSPVAAAVDSLANEHLPHSDTPERITGLLPAHAGNSQVRVDEREQLSTPDSTRNPLLFTPASTRNSSPPSSVSPVEVCGAAGCHPARLQGGVSDQGDHRRMQNTPTTKAPGGPQTPSLTPATSCSISEASTPDEGAKFAHTVADFTPRHACEMEDEHLAEHRRDDLQAQAGNVRSPTELGRIGMGDAEDSTTTSAKPVQVLHELEALDTVNSTALLMQDIVELISKWKKRRVLDCWSQLWTIRRKREFRVAEYRARVLSSRHKKHLAFITWTRVSSQHSTESQKDRCQASGRATKERNLCQIWFSYARRRAALVGVITPVLDMQKCKSRHSTKRLAFEIWNRHASVMIWTHGRLRLAAHKSRVITLTGILKRLRHFVAEKQASSSVAAQVDRRAERALIKKIWMALVAHIIEQQMQAAIDSPSRSPQFRLSTTSGPTHGSPLACRKSLFGYAPSHKGAEVGRYPR